MTTQDIALNRPAARPAFQRTSRSWWRTLIANQEFGVFMLLLMMCLYLYLKTDTFTSPVNVSNVILAFSWIAIAALGQTLVIIIGGIDLSTGSVMALSGLAAAYWISGDKSPWAVKQITDTGREIMVVDSQYVPIALLAGCLMGLFLGALNGVLVAWGGLPPFIATLGTMSIVRGICYGWAEGWPFRQLNDDFRDIGQKEFALPIINYDLPYPTIIMAALVLIMSIFLIRTIWGYRVYAIGGNEQAAQLSGINTRHVKLLAFSLSGLMAGIGGTLMTARLGVAMPTAAQGYELDVIAAVFIGGASVKGGKGTMIGALIGAATMGVLRNGLNLVGVDAYWQPAAIGSVIIIAIMLDRARQNPQAQAYFRQLEGRVAVVSVLLLVFVSFAVAVLSGLGADAMLALLFSLPGAALAYFLFYKSVINPPETLWKRVGAAALFLGLPGLATMWQGTSFEGSGATMLQYFAIGVATAAVVAVIWQGVRWGMKRLSEASPEARFEVSVGVASVGVMMLISFIAALVYGIKTDALLIVVAALPVFAGLYLLYYVSLGDASALMKPGAWWVTLIWIALAVLIAAAAFAFVYAALDIAYEIGVVDTPALDLSQQITLAVVALVFAAVGVALTTGFWRFVIRRAMFDSTQKARRDEPVAQGVGA